MKYNKSIIMIFFIMSSYSIFAQSTSIYDLSLRHQYNTLTREYQILGAFGEYPIYFFYGFDDYSDAIVWENTSERLFFQTLQKQFWTLQIAQKGGTQFITFGGGFPENNTIERIFIGYETYDKSYDENKRLIITKIIPNDSMPPRFFIYHNTPRKELLRLYLTNFLQSVDYILNREWIQRNREVSARDVEVGRNVFEKEYNMAEVNNLLNILTKHELSIFRNYMFARHNFAFRTQTWNNFFREYYRPNYNGTRTNEEVMTIMTEWEREILNMIVEIENQH